jgi:hypothetical protein
MACLVEIHSAIGVGSPLAQIVIFGRVEDCPKSFEGGNLEVTLSCRSAEDPEPKTKVVDVLPSGLWIAEFLSPLLGCACGGEVFVTARCLTDEMCAAAPFLGTLPCDTCPKVEFDAGDDVGLPVVAVECDIDGSALVKINFSWTNDTPNFVQARVNPGPGGVVVTSDVPFVGPNSSAMVTVLLRYDPQLVPQPSPFVEFVRLSDFSVLACPPHVIPAGTLPECADTGCPLMVAVEVTDAAGNGVQVSGPNAVLCLLPGEYTLAVVSPLPQPGMEFWWSEGGELIPPVVSQPSITVQLAGGTPREFSVSVDVPNCPNPSAMAELVGCVINCDTTVDLKLRDLQGLAVPTAGCVPPGNYMVHAVGPVEPPWDFEWNENGTTSISQTASAYPLTVIPGGGHSVQVTASAPGCGDKTAVLNILGCEEPADDSASCGTFLLATLGLLLVGLIALVAGICLGSTPTIVAGVVATAVALILFGIWWYYCSKTTSCTTLQTARCLLIYAGLLFFAIGLLLYFVSGTACGIATILTNVGWFGLATFIEDVMTLKGCPKKTCYF